MAAAAGDSADKNNTIFFYIPAEALPDALAAYSSITSTQVLVDNDLIAPFRSTTVTGMFTREAALDILLEGTGLVAHPIGQDALTLVPGGAGVVAPPPQAGPPPTAETQHNPPDYRQYSAAMQASITRALCDNANTRPGTYRILIQLWLDPAGNVVRLKLLETTGSGIRDAALIRTLKKLTIGEGPPADLPQPITLLISPRASGPSTECATPDAPGP